VPSIFPQIGEQFGKECYCPKNRGTDIPRSGFAAHGAGQHERRLKNRRTDVLRSEQHLVPNSGGVVFNIWKA